MLVLFNMTNKLTHVDYEDEPFSAYTHPTLEDFIQRVIDQNRSSLPTTASQKLLREFLLYGFLKVSGQQLNDAYDRPLWTEEGFNGKWPNYVELGLKRLMPEGRIREKTAGKFWTNNGILALCDFDGEVYIRGADGYHRSRGLPDELINGIDGTLLGLGYRSGGINVPHSNGDYFVDPRKEKLFELLDYFSIAVRTLRGEPTHGVIVKDLSKDEPSAPYQRRDPKLPRIVIKDTLLIPGNRDRTLVYNSEPSPN